MTLKRILLLCIFISAGHFCRSQINETFTDGDFSVNPAWSGTGGSWIINSSHQLQSNNTIANSTFFISTVNTLAVNTQWEFNARLNFNTSSLNYTDVFLTASAADLSAAGTTGYFVRIGDAGDDICLYRKDAGGAISKLIDGRDGTTNTSDNILKIRVIRKNGNAFTLFTDISGTGNSYVSEGTASDAAYTSSAFFGFLIKQSTGSFFQKHYFDNITVQPFAPDVTPPATVRAFAASSTDADVLFSESLDANSAGTVLNYTVDHGIGIPATSFIDTLNNALVHLHFTHPFSTGTTYNITINGIKDLAGNTLNGGFADFEYYQSKQFDVIIDEVMADPSPSAGLPDAEYVELKNISGRPIDITGWRLNTLSSASGLFPGYIFQPGEFLILCTASHVPDLSPYGNVMGVPSFPAIPNSGTVLFLTSKEGRTVHAVTYNKDLYQNTVKADGGWSLEMIDTHLPCAGTGNWKPSADAEGGTPGKINSIDGISDDPMPPRLLRTYSKDSVTVIAVFSKPLDSTLSSLPGNFSFTPGLTITSSSPQPPLFSSVALTLSAPMVKQQIYWLTVTNIADCSGNTIGIYNAAKAGLAEDADTGQVVINEILFNPRPGCMDYVEVFNRSNKIFDAYRLYIANRNDAGNVSNAKKLCDTTLYLFPGDYLVLTEDPDAVKRQYLVTDPEAIIQRTAMPSYPDNMGDVIITNIQGAVVDEVLYSDAWQFPLISNTEGVALERVDPSAPSSKQDNWHSAATTAGYGTPGYKNSQYKRTDDIQATLTITPQLFSPDNDGMDDICTIHYELEEKGYIANITIFDANGKLVRYLVKNDLLGLKGSWNWNGLNEQNQKPAVGTYIIYTEIFNLQGKKKQFKQTVVLAGRR